MTDPFITESVHRAKSSDVYLLMYGLPLNVSEEAGERAVLAPSPEDAHISYRPPGYVRAGSAAVACSLRRNGEEEARGMICTRIPSKVGSWLLSVFAASDKNDPRVWLNIEQWPPDYHERLALAVRESLFGDEDDIV